MMLSSEMGFAAALLVARLRRRSHHGVQQQGSDGVEKSREPVLQGMLLEMTPRGLRVSQGRRHNVLFTR